MTKDQYLDETSPPAWDNRQLTQMYLNLNTIMIRVLERLDKLERKALYTSDE